MRPGALALRVASGPAEAVRVEPDAVADVQVADVLALEGPRAAIVESDVDAVADHSRFVVALDIVAGDRAAGSADAGHRRPAEPVAELVAEDASQHAADDRTRARPLRSLAHRFDRRDRAGPVARRDCGLHP